MVEKYKLLLKMQLYNALGINRLLHSHDIKEKKRSAAVAVLGSAAVILLVTYSANFSRSMAEAGLVQALPAIMVVICSFVTLVLTFIKSTGVLIGLKDYDMVMSLPVNTLAIVLSRMTMVYLINFLIGFAAVLPSGFTYVMYQKPDISGYIMLLGALFLIPVLPMIIALLAGVLIVAVSVRFKHKNLISLSLSTAGVLLIVYLSAAAQGMDEVQIANAGEALTNAVNRFYPPAALLSNGLLYGDWASFAVFAAGSLSAGFLFAVLAAYFYKTLNTSIFSHHTNKNYKPAEMSLSSPFMALYKKELNCLASCTIYALNSCIGIVLGFVVSVMAVFFMPDTLKMQPETLEIMKLILNVLPLVPAVFVSMTSTTAASLSLEGKNRWIMCSVPVKAITVYHAKIAVNLTVILPVLFISTVLLRIGFPLSVIQTIFLFLVPAVYAFFISVMGMYLNIRFPKYDWTSEYYAVKGGAVSVLAAVGTGMAGSLVPLYLCMLFSEYSTAVMLGTTAAIAAITIAVYGRICKITLYAV